MLEELNYLWDKEFKPEYQDSIKILLKYIKDLEKIVEEGQN